MNQSATDIPRRAHSRLRRWLYAALGVACVALGAVGAVVPGLPTTVFLLAASWLFARSCPWLEDRLFRLPLFRPFLRYLEPGARMPLRARVATLVVMWGAIAISATVLMSTETARPVIASAVVVAGLVGSLFVVRLGRTRRSAAGSSHPEAGPSRRVLSTR
jgi:uncharacterized membrane protein YbaN (DUF454 family)